MVDLSPSKPTKPGNDSPISSLGSGQSLPSTPPLTQPPEKKPPETTAKTPLPPLEKEEKIVTAKQKDIEKELSEIGISPKHTSKKTKIVMAALGVLLLIATLPAAIYLVQQRQEIRKEAFVGNSCAGDGCNIEIGPGNLTFETAGHGFRWHCLSRSDCEQNGSEVKETDIYVSYPTGATVKEAYAIWSGEGCHTTNTDCTAENQTTIKVNGHNATAIKSFVDQNPKFPNNTQSANIAKLDPASIPSPSGGELKFHVSSLSNFYANGHGMSIIVIYQKPDAGYNKIILKLWGEWLYKACAAQDDRSDCEGAHSKVMNINLPDLDTTRTSDNKFAWFAGEGELNSRDTSKKDKACIDDESGNPRPSHLYYQVPGGNWTMISPTDSPPAPYAWFACPMDPGAWWVTRVTGVNMPKINLTGNSIKFTADSAWLPGEPKSDGESYTFVGAVVQYPVEAPSYKCWDECSQQTDCDPAGLTCDTSPGDTIKRCLNSQCPSEETCVCPVTICLGLTADPAVETLEEGSEVEFTCKGSGGDNLDHFEFRVEKDNSGTWEDLGSATATKTNSDYEGKVNYKVSATGSYRAECRVCTSSDSTVCTQWGRAE
jgi:hypothetical protein